MCRLYLGWKPNDPAVERGASSIARTGPSKDLYYDYYATLLMSHMRPELWLAWRAQMEEMILRSQAESGHEAGSWFADLDAGHGASAAGRLYCTALAALILETCQRPEAADEQGSAKHTDRRALDAD